MRVARADAEGNLWHVDVDRETERVRAAREPETAITFVIEVVERLMELLGCLKALIARTDLEVLERLDTDATHDPEDLLLHGLDRLLALPAIRPEDVAAGGNVDAGANAE